MATEHRPDKNDGEKEVDEEEPRWVAVKPPFEKACSTKEQWTVLVGEFRLEFQPDENFLLSNFEFFHAILRSGGNEARTKTVWFQEGKPAEWVEIVNIFDPLQRNSINSFNAHFVAHWTNLLGNPKASEICKKESEECIPATLKRIQSKEAKRWDFDIVLNHLETCRFLLSEELLRNCIDSVVLFIDNLPSLLGIKEQERIVKLCVNNSDFRDEIWNRSLAKFCQHKVPANHESVVNGSLPALILEFLYVAENDTENITKPIDCVTTVLRDYYEDSAHDEGEWSEAEHEMEKPQRAILEHDNFDKDVQLRARAEFPASFVTNESALSCLNAMIDKSPRELTNHLLKAIILTESRRWSDVAAHCERLACAILVDSTFSNEPQSDAPVIAGMQYSYGDPLMPGYLSQNVYPSYGFNAVGAAEVALRLPVGLVPFYIRSLRLESRRHEAQAALNKLQEYPRPGLDAYSPRAEWINTEKCQLTATLKVGTEASSLMENDKMTAAANQYAKCILIHTKKSCGFVGGGGLVNAVLHSNRSKCFRKEKKIDLELMEYNAMLRINPTYMKAYIRRARLYRQFGQYDKAIEDYKVWLAYVEDGRVFEQTHGLLTRPWCGPSAVQDEELEQRKSELADLLKKKADLEEPRPENGQI